MNITYIWLLRKLRFDYKPGSSGMPIGSKVAKNVLWKN